MRVLVTRPREDAEAMARRLAALGHEAILAPATRIVATGVTIPAGPFDATLATSRHAIATPSPAELKPLLAPPLHCVGARTAELANARGFLDVRPAAPDVATLIASLAGAPRKFLYLAGEDRKPALETALRARGAIVETLVVYAARAETALPDDAIAALRAGRVDAALHYSRRSADLLIALARAAGVFDRLVALAHVCISADAAAPLMALGGRTIIAATLDGAGMVAGLKAI